MWHTAGHGGVELRTSVRNGQKRCRSWPTVFAEPLIALDHPGLGEPPPPSSSLYSRRQCFHRRHPGPAEQPKVSSKVQQHRVLSGRDDLVPTEVFVSGVGGAGGGGVSLTLTSTRCPELKSMECAIPRHLAAIDGDSISARRPALNGGPNKYPLLLRGYGSYILKMVRGKLVVITSPWIQYTCN